MSIQQQSHHQQAVEKEAENNYLCQFKPIKLKQSKQANKFKKLIIHDIHLLSRRRKIVKEQLAVTQQRTASLKELLLQTILPGQHQHLEVLKTGISYRHENQQYLKNNMNSIKQKIRNKVLKQKIDFADTPKPKLSLCERRVASKDNSAERERINKYNHDFEEYLIRKKINIKKCHTLSYDLPTNASNLHEEISPQDRTKKTSNLLILCRSNTEGGQEETNASKMIIVSHLNPAQNSVKFKNTLIQTARKSMSKYQQAQQFLKKYVNRHFNRATKSYQKPLRLSQQKKERDFCSLKIKSEISPITFIKSPLNFTLAKKELNRLRKENIGLPLLMQAQNKSEAQRNQAKLQQRLNARKITSHSQQSKKHVVYSKKNVEVMQNHLEDLLQQERTLIL